MTENEKNLLAGCIRGDKASWDAFVRQYSNLVYHTIRKTLALHHTETSPDTADDLFKKSSCRWSKTSFSNCAAFAATMVALWRVGSE
jgi:hypothetical protein